MITQVKTKEEILEMIPKGVDILMNHTDFKGNQFMACAENMTGRYNIKVTVVTMTRKSGVSLNDTRTKNMKIDRTELQVNKTRFKLLFKKINKENRNQIFEETKALKENTTAIFVRL